MNISGHLDLCGPDLIEGWLYCDAFDAHPVKLQVYVDGVLLGECIANRFRPDLQEAGFGDGRCGFSFAVPDHVTATDVNLVKLRLVGTPLFLLPDDHSRVRGAVTPLAAPDTVFHHHDERAAADAHRENQW